MGRRWAVVYQWGQRVEGIDRETRQIHEMGNHRRRMRTQRRTGEINGFRIDETGKWVNRCSNGESVNGVHGGGEIVPKIAGKMLYINRFRNHGNGERRAASLSTVSTSSTPSTRIIGDEFGSILRFPDRSRHRHQRVHDRWAGWQIAFIPWEPFAPRASSPQGGISFIFLVTVTRRRHRREAGGGRAARRFRVRRAVSG